MRALTVRQPWAWAIAHGGKNIENRTTLWRYRGPLAIHAGGKWSPPRSSLDALTAAWRRIQGPGVPLVPTAEPFVYGAIIAVAELVDVHVQTSACDPAVCLPWGEESFTASDGRRRTAIVHLVLVDVRVVDPPVPCAGYQGLWTVPDHLLPELEQNLG